MHEQGDYKAGAPVFLQGIPCSQPPCTTWVPTSSAPMPWPSRQWEKSSRTMTVTSSSQPMALGPSCPQRDESPISSPWYGMGKSLHSMPWHLADPSWQISFIYISSKGHGPAEEQEAMIGEKCRDGEGEQGWSLVGGAWKESDDKRKEWAWIRALLGVPCTGPAQQGIFPDRTTMMRTPTVRALRVCWRATSKACAQCSFTGPPILLLSSTRWPGKITWRGLRRTREPKQGTDFPRIIRTILSELGLRGEGESLC